MIFSTEAGIQGLSIHYSGNPAAGEDCILSDQPTPLPDETLEQLLIQYFTASFEKTTEIFGFTHTSGDLGLNEMFHFSSLIFEDPSVLHDTSRKIMRHLYECSGHPRIRPGEVYVVYFRQLQVEGELTDALGIFKSETKESYLKVNSSGGDFSISYEQDAINIRKPDKGCLIFNTKKEEGYKVAVIDQTNRGAEAAYWVDEFLKLKARNDEYAQTHAVLKVYKEFVTDKLGESFDLQRTDKIDLLNRSIKYFKENDQFNLQEFSEEVIANEEGIRSFHEYKNNYEQEYGTSIDDQFAISNAAVKRQARIYRSILKLDRNFHVYIHGNKEMIEKGYDEQTGLHYYKLYFREEN
jgi:hypothetical protein